MDFKAIREDRLAEATKKAQKKGMSEELAQGKAEDEARGIAFVARRMLARGLLPDLIAEDIWLSLDEVESLRSSE